MMWNHPHELARRATTTGRLVLGVLLVITVAFFRLQILGAERYATHSDQNRLRPIVLPAPRGVVTDRHGEVLAENIPSYSISLLGGSESGFNETLHRVAPIIGLGDDRVAEIMGQRPVGGSNDAVVIARDVPFEAVSIVEERRRAFPGLVIQTEPKRRYPQGDGVAHVVGYVQELTEEELRDQVVAGARPGALIGRAGLERTYDDRLRGQDGRRFVEVDALGRTVRSDVGVPDGLPPVPGDTIRTTIDMDLQRYAEGLFPDGALGAVVAMNPQNGEVLALYSAPSFDPNQFIGGVDPEVWRSWLASGNPLFNRVIQGRYPPASPWKLAVAAMALRRGLITARSRMPTPCHGGIQYFNRFFRCWKADGHGDLTLSEAIQHSCNVYFYQLGQQLGLDQILDDGAAWGFGDATGIDLPNEYTPLFPPSVAYFDERYGPRGWTSAVTLNLAIGQGENAQTLINMVRFYAMLANETGRAARPRLVLDVPTRFDDGSLELSRTDLLDLRHALELVVDEGTAVRSRIENLRIAGKTGTAQNPQGPDHGWFVAFAPAEAPEIVVGAIVQYGEHGSSVAPIVTNLIARALLGPDVPADTGVQWQLPADSVPGPVVADSVPQVAAEEVGIE